MLRLLLPLALLVLAAPAQAVEQNCRFIQAKAEREACYKRQEAELAARRKPEQPAATTGDFETMQLQRREDAEVYRSMRGICRGC